MTQHHDGQGPGGKPPTLYAVPPPGDYRDGDHTGDGGGRTPPNNRDAEQAVLGALLTQPSSLDDVADTLTPADFYTPRHELIYGAITALAADGQPIDLVTVADRLTTTRDLNRAGGAPYLHDLTTNAPLAATAAYHARIVATYARRRALVHAGTRITELGHATTDDPDTATAAATHLLHEAIAHRGPTATSTWQPVDVEAYLNGDNLDTPAPAVLARADGPCLLYAGAVHSIAGEPESGKSWVAIHAATQELEQAHNVLFIDFEDRPQRVIARFLAAGAHPAQIAQHLRYIRPDTALNPTTAAHLTQAATGTTLAVIDGITEAMTLHGLSLLDNEDVARWLALLPRRLADLGPAVLQIDHVIKNAEQRGRYAIGGQHKLAGIDGCAYKITVTEPFGRGKRGHARLTLDKDREGHVRAIALGHTVATLTLDSRPDQNHPADQLRIYLDAPQADVGPDGAFRPTGLMERVSRYLELNPAAVGRDITATVKGNDKALRDAIRALINEGYIRTQDVPKRGVAHWSERPFREDDR